MSRDDLTAVILLIFFVGFNLEGRTTAADLREESVAFVQGIFLGETVLVQRFTEFQITPAPLILKMENRDHQGTRESQQYGFTGHLQRAVTSKWQYASFSGASEQGWLDPDIEPGYGLSQKVPRLALVIGAGSTFSDGRLELETDEGPEPEDSEWEMDVPLARSFGEVQVHLALEAGYQESEFAAILGDGRPLFTRLRGNREVAGHIEENEDLMYASSGLVCVPDMVEPGFAGTVGLSKNTPDWLALFLIVLKF